MIQWLSGYLSGIATVLVAVAAWAWRNRRHFIALYKLYKQKMADGKLTVEEVIELILEAARRFGFGKKVVIR